MLVTVPVNFENLVPELVKMESSLGAVWFGGASAGTDAGRFQKPLPVFVPVPVTEVKAKALSRNKKMRRIVLKKTSTYFF